MNEMNTQNQGKKASTIIREKLSACGGRATMPLFNGQPCVIMSDSDGKTFSSSKLGSQKMAYDVFDCIIRHLQAHGGKARKGMGRGKNDKVGDGKCTLGTVMYAVATEYYGKRDGESTFDPIFVLAAVLEWAGIAENGRGYIRLINY